jgi:hypothetical protein
LKRKSIILLFCFFANHNFAQDFNDSLLKLYLPNTTTIIKNKIKKIEFFDKDFRKKDKPTYAYYDIIYNPKNGKIIEEHNKTKDGKGDIYNYKTKYYYYKKNYLDSIIEINSEYSYFKEGQNFVKKFISNYKTVYSEKSNNTNNGKEGFLTDSLYLGKVTQYESDSINMKMQIKVYPELNKRYVDKNAVEPGYDYYPQGNDTTKYYYDNKKRLIKTFWCQSKRNITVNYNKDTIIVEEDNLKQNKYWKYVYYFRNNYLKQIIWYISNEKSQMKIFSIDKYLYKNGVPIKIFSKVFRENEQKEESTTYIKFTKEN